jgi:hypothetical protein
MPRQRRPGKGTANQLTLFSEAPIDGEVLEPHEHDRIEGNTAKERLKDALRASFDRVSINYYLRVFGAVPDRRPARQWLCEGRDTYIHIADVWKDPELRERILERLWRRRAYRLHRYVSRDLEYLDRFAGLPPPSPLNAREIGAVRRMLLPKPRT